MKPGTSIAPCASTTRVAAVTSFCTSALDPTAAKRSPRTATALAQGRPGSPVHTCALTIAREICPDGAGEAEGKFTQEPRETSIARPELTVPIWAVGGGDVHSLPLQRASKGGSFDLGT